MTKLAKPNIVIEHRDVGQPDGRSIKTEVWVTAEGESLQVPAPKRDGYIYVSYPEIYIAVNYGSDIQYHLIDTDDLLEYSESRGFKAVGKAIHALMVSFGWAINPVIS